MMKKMTPSHYKGSIPFILNPATTETKEDEEEYLAGRKTRCNEERGGGDGMEKGKKGERERRTDRTRRRRMETTTMMMPSKDMAKDRRIPFGKRFPRSVQQALKDAYSEDSRPTAEKQIMLSERLGLTQYQVKIW